MSGLEEVGVPGPDHLREALTNCTDPLAAIEEFQLQNGILLPSLRPALPFLDLHGVMRHDFHQSVMEELRDRLLQRIREIANGSDKNKHRMLNELLAKSIAVIKVKALRPVIMCILQHLPKIRHEHLLIVMQDRDLYMEAPVEVKQHIWQDNQALFGDEVSPLLSRYIDLKESVLFTTDTSQSAFFSATPKSRRQADVVQDLARMIGHNIRLYDMVLQFLRTLFMRTRNVHYCTLRAELLMALHDNDVQEITSADPCHKFTWCLDACIRDRLIDSKRMRELHGFLDSVGGFHQQQVLGDLAMILCDCQAVQVLCATVMKTLQQCAANETLPRASDELIFALRMLNLGLGAWQIIDSQVFMEPKLDATVVTRLLPSILSLILDDQMSTVSAAKDDPQRKAEPLPKALLRAGQRGSDCVRSTLLVQYFVSVAKQSNVPQLIRLVSFVTSHCDTELAYNDTTLHELVSSLSTSPLAESFANTEFTEAVFDKFFLPQITRENVTRHVLRLLYFIHHHLSALTLDKLMKTMEPSRQHSELVHTTYQTLLEKITSAPPVLISTPSVTSSQSVVTDKHPDIILSSP